MTKAKLRKVALSLAKKTPATTSSDDLPTIKDLATEIVQGRPNKAEELKHIAIERIHKSPYQPRRIFNEEDLEALAATIRQQGIVQPIVVRPSDSDSFELLAGERRWRAAMVCGLTEIPAIVRDVSDENAQVIALIENLQRVDLNPIEQAHALKSLQDSHNIQQNDLCNLIGKAKSTVSSLLGLLKLDDRVQTLILENKLTSGHAKTLITLKKNAHYEWAQKSIQRGWSVRQLEQAIARSKPDKKSPNKSHDPNVVALSNSISEWLGAPVDIKQNNIGKGRSKDKGMLVIKYHSNEELSGILERMGFKAE